MRHPAHDVTLPFLFELPQNVVQKDGELRILASSLLLSSTATIRASTTPRISSLTVVVIIVLHLPVRLCRVHGVSHFGGTVGVGLLCLE